MKPFEIIQPLGVHLYVAFTQASYKNILMGLGVPTEPPSTEEELAFVHVFTARGKFNMVVAVDSENSVITSMNAEALRKVVIHEATHVMQYYTEIIGDEKRAPEFEACFMEYMYELLWGAVVSSRQFPVLVRPTKKKKFK